MPKLVVYAAGSNSHGQLGVGHQDDAHVFTRCTLELGHSDASDTQIKICAGSNHTLLLVKRESGSELYVAGSSKSGQLGAVKSENALSFEPFNITDHLLNAPSDNATVQDIAAGWETSFFLVSTSASPEAAATTSTTRLLACGSNDFGQLGQTGLSSAYTDINLPTSSPIRNVVSGPRHTVAYTEDGELFGWGASRHGQLGEAATLAISYDPVRMPKDLVNVSQPHRVALGQQHTCLLDDKAGVAKPIRTYGNNRKGQLGSLDTDDKVGRPACKTFMSDRITSNVRDLEVYSNWNTTFVLDRMDSPSEIYSFGNNANGQLGRESRHPGDTGSVEFPQPPFSTPVTLSSRIELLAAGSEHALAVIRIPSGRVSIFGPPPQDELYGWGWNEHGNLGRGENELRDVKVPERIPLPGPGKVHSLHAGNGTSWVIMQED